MTTSVIITVALLDDHPVLVRGVKDMLDHIPWLKVTGAYEQVVACLQDFEKHGSPKVLLMDIHMPDQNGEDLATLLHRKYPSLSIIVYTSADQHYYLQSMLLKGVAGYVIKSSGEEVLLDAIKTVVNGTSYFDPVIRDHALGFLKKKTTAAVSVNLVLTNREKEILNMLAENYSSNEIADKLYISKRTVDTHRANLLLKLDVKSTPSLLKKATDLGLIK